MPAPASGMPTQAPQCIDLTGDSDDESVCQVQVVTPAENTVKQEPGEEKTTATDIESALGGTEATNVEPSIEYISIPTKPDHEVDSITPGKLNIRHTKPKPIQLEVEEFETTP